MVREDSFGAQLGFVDGYVLHFLALGVEKDIPGKCLTAVEDANRVCHNASQHQSPRLPGVMRIFYFNRIGYFCLLLLSAVLAWTRMPLF